jgi:hypothetical protein
VLTVVRLLLNPPPPIERDRLEMLIAMTEDALNTPNAAQNEARETRTPVPGTAGRVPENEGGTEAHSVPGMTA